jgi:hypothetical protein
LTAPEPFVTIRDMPPRTGAGQLVIATLVLGLGLAAVAGVFGAGQPQAHGLPTPRPGGTRPAPHDTVTPIILTHQQVSNLAWGGGGLWVVLNGTRVGWINPLSLQLHTTARIRGLCQDSQIAYGAGAAWVTTGGCLLPGRVIQITPGSFAVHMSGPAPGYVRGVAVWRGHPWVSIPAGGPAILAVNAGTVHLHGQRLTVDGQLQDSNDSPRFASLLASPYALWGVDAEPLNGITSIRSVGRNRLDGSTYLPQLPVVAVPLTAGGGYVWGAFGKTIAGVPTSRPPSGAGRTIQVRAPAEVLGLTYAAGQVWFATPDAVYRLRPGASTPLRFTRLPFRIDALTAGGGYLWAAAAGTGGLARIGPLPAAVHAPAVGVIAG